MSSVHFHRQAPKQASMSATGSGAGAGRPSTAPNPSQGPSRSGNHTSRDSTSLRQEIWTSILLQASAINVGHHRGCILRGASGPLCTWPGAPRAQGGRGACTKPPRGSEGLGRAPSVCRRRAEGALPCLPWPTDLVFRTDLSSRGLWLGHQKR